MRKFILTIVCGGLLCSASTTHAQTLFAESFDLAGGFAAQGWTLIDADGGTVNASVSGQFGATASWLVDADIDDATDSVAMSTSWMDPVMATDDWMITPMIAGIAAATTLDWIEEAQDAAYPDGYQVWATATIAGGTPVTTDFTTSGTMIFSTPAASGGVWAPQSVSLAAFAGGNVWIAWRNNSTDMFVLMIDDILVGVPVASDDLAIDSVAGEYTQIPLPQVAAMNLEAFCSNVGTNNITDAVVTCNVYYNAGLVQTTASASTAISAGTSASLNAGTYTPSGAGTYEFEYLISTALGTDVDPTNDTLSYFFIVDSNYYSRDDGNITIALGIGAGTAADLGNVYEVNASGIMDSVFFFRNGILGDTTQVIIYSTVAGVPTTLVGQSVEHIFTTADSSSSGRVYTLAVTDLSSNPLVLAPGSYYVGVKEYFSSANMALAFTNDLFTAGTVFGSIAGGPHGTLESLGFPNTAVVRARFTPSCTEFTFASTTTNSGCGLTDGSATAVSTSGTGPFTYVWDAAAANQTTQTATNLGAGVYVVSVSDAGGCSYNDTVTVINPSAPTGTTSVDANVSCNGGTDGSVSAVGAGGTSPYTFLWDDSSNQTTATATGLVAGTYNCTITDSSGCAVTVSVTVTEPTVLSGSIVDNLDSTITATATGGTPPYTYLWDAAAGNQTTATATGLAAGTYACVMTDSNGCTTNGSVTTTVGISDYATKLDIEAFPNPVKEILTISYNFDANENITIKMINNVGQIIKVVSVNNVISGQLELNTANFASGMYLLNVTTETGSFVKSIVVSH
jgi:hypothetical protein